MNSRRLFKTFGIVAFIILLFLVPVFLKSPYWIHVLILVGINVILAVSLRNIACVGQLSLGHAGFMLIGAYTSALLVMKVGVSFWVAILLGGLLPAAIALVIGYPFLRAKGIYFSIMTLILGEVFRIIADRWVSLTGGEYGLQNIPAPDPITIPGIATIVFDSKTDYYYLIMVIVLLCILIFYRLEHSRLGLTWRAIREADSLADAVGINILGHKILAFAVGCFFAGIAGALFAHYLHMMSTVASGKFGVMSSIYILVYMVVGGQAYFAGPIVGAFVLTIVPEFARALKECQPLIFGGLLILVMFLFPEGIAGLPNRFSSWRRRGGRHRKDGANMGASADSLPPTSTGTG